MNPQTPADLDGTAQQLLRRAAATVPADTATAAALIDRAHTRGRIRRRNRRLAWSAAVTSTAAVAVVLALTLPGSNDSTRRLVPANPSTPTASSDATAGGFALPSLTPQADDAPDRAGLEGYDWRAQVRESMQRYPDAFVVPQRLPADIATVETRLHNGHPALDVSAEGPGVVVCAADLATCREGLGDDWRVVRAGEVDSRPYQVLVSPPGKPTDTGLTAQQEEFWTTVAFTTSAPDWLDSTD